LVYGLGDIGQSTARSCSKYLKAHSVTVINRTNSVAHDLAKEVNVHVSEHNELRDKINDSDIVIVATGASNPTVLCDMIPADKKQLIIDLSIPRNVEPLINDLKNTDVIDVDVLSKKTKKTIEERKKQIPLAEKIIQKYKSEFYEWLMFRRSTPAINSLKKSLEVI
jgi:glutamyl-tRNA reductase